MEKKKKKEYWLFTIMTDYNHYVNCWFDEFPTHTMLMDACHKYNGNKYAIINITKLTEEQFDKLFTEEKLEV